MIGKELALSDDFSGLERTYIRVFGAPIVGLRIRARNVFSLIPRQPYQRILDCGSGPGVFAFELCRQYRGAEVLGIDILDSEVSRAEEIRQKAGYDNVRFTVANILDRPFDAEFDLAVCVDILEHIEDDRAALAGLYQALRPGGALVLHVPAYYRRYPVFRKSVNFDVETHVRSGYEPEDIQNKVREAGFVIEQSGFTYGFFETLANNLSYMITGARMKNKKFYALAFPFLNLLALLGARARPAQLGAGVYAVARRPA